MSALPREHLTASDRAERSLLASIVLAPYMLELTTRLEPRDFRSPRRGQVLSAMRGLTARGVPWDCVVLVYELERLHGPGSPPWRVVIGDVMAEASCAEEFVEGYARIVLEASLLRSRGPRP